MKRKVRFVTYFSDEQLKTLSDILKEIGNIFFASTIVPFLLGIDKISLPVVLLVLIVTFCFWLGSLLLVKGIKYDHNH